MDADLRDAALAVGLAARLTRLIVVDSIFDGPRERALAAADRIAGNRGLDAAEDLVTCPHCVGVWVAAAVVGSYLLAGRRRAAWRAAAATAALSYATGHLVARLDVEEDS